MPRWISNSRVLENSKSKKVEGDIINDTATF